ncbi:MAG: PepSY-associated TM helix domain-containing protein [Rhizobacter sp.]|nr:PepSY-associated TM helix domain-containing protein [Rhizobacter sp.]
MDSSTSLNPPAPARAKASHRRAWWLKQLHRWHWISSALSLVGLLLFAVTGFTLNHASQIESQPRVNTQRATLPAPLRAELAAGPRGNNNGDNLGNDNGNAPLPGGVARWVDTAFGLDVAGRTAEWSADEVYLALPRPGGDAWLRIARDSGEAEHERTDRGVVSYLNDLHKGRYTGAVWSVFIDVFAVACLVFAITGLFILKLHAAKRPSTWPIVAAGLVLPLLLAALFIH